MWIQHRVLSTIHDQLPFFSDPAASFGDGFINFSFFSSMMYVTIFSVLQMHSELACHQAALVRDISG